jgi:hypothetical protein
LHAVQAAQELITPDIIAAIVNGWFHNMWFGVKMNELFCKGTLVFRKYCVNLRSNERTCTGFAVQRAGATLKFMKLIIQEFQENKTRRCLASMLLRTMEATRSNKAFVPTPL